MSKATNTIFKQPVLLVTLPQESADTNDEK